MTKPVRLQLSRRKGFDLQALSLTTNGLPAVVVARPGKWGNPYKVGGPAYTVTKSGSTRLRKEPLTDQEAVDLYRRRECGTYSGQRIIPALGSKLT